LNIAKADRPAVVMMAAIADATTNSRSVYAAM
jgi:hypothetical protein